MASRNSKGRMLYWKISYCKQLTRVSLLSKLLFTWAMPNIDNLGRMEGEPAILKGMIFPYEDKISPKDIENALKELANEYLIMWYAVGGNWYIQFPKVLKYQKLEKNNSKESDYPDPPRELVEKYNDYFKNVEECSDMYLHVPCEGKGREGEEKGKEYICASGFEQFWQAYPKRRSKGQAEKAWKKLKPNEQLHNAIMQSLERAKTSAEWQKDGGQFIPYPATWLNAKGWEDEYASKKEYRDEWGID